jgi:hypothetical protein
MSVVTDMLELLRKGQENPAPSVAPGIPTDLASLMAWQPKSYAGWRNWVVNVIGPALSEDEMLEFSEVPLTKGHITPLRAGWELYCLCCGHSNDDTWRVLTAEELATCNTSFVVKGSRGGTKTLMLTIVGWTVMLFNPYYGWQHTASVKEQAERVWGYLEKLTRMDGRFGYMMKRPWTKTGRVQLINESEATIGVGNEKGQNSKHPQLLTFDEVEFMKYVVIAEGKLSGRRRKRLDGTIQRPVYIYCSSQKKPNETMYTLLTEAEEGKHVLLEWNLWDVIEKCEDWRRKRLHAGLTCSDWDAIQLKIDALEKNSTRNVKQDEELQKLQHSRKLLLDNCRLVEWCKGIAINGQGHYDINEAIEKTKLEGSYFTAQMLGQQPQMDGAVYPKFSTKENVSDLAVYHKGTDIYAGVDYGFSADPTVLILAQQFGRNIDIFYEHDFQHISSARLPDAFALALRNIGLKPGDITSWTIPHDATELQSHMNDRAFRVWVPRAKRDRRQMARIEAMSKAIYDDGFRALRINPSCKMLIRTLVIYTVGTDGLPRPGQYDHHPDAAGYVVLRMSKQGNQPSGIINPGRLVGRSTWR